MSDLDQPPSDPADDLAALQPKKSKAPWFIAIVVLASAAFTMWLYGQFEQRGITLKGPGHLVVLPAEKGGAWAMYLEGMLVHLTPKSVAKLGAKTGPCEDITGSIEGDQLDLESLTCTPGAPLQKQIGERLRRAGFKFGYWPKSVPFTGDTLEPYLETPEIVADMLDSRPEWPQLLSIYTPLFPQTLAAQRDAGRLPVPLVLAVRRDDLKIVRFTKTEVSHFLARPAYHLAGAAAQGGWIVRTVEIDPAADVFFERLLLNPEEDPWPVRLAMPTIRAARRTPLPASLAGGAATPAVETAETAKSAADAGAGTGP